MSLLDVHSDSGAGAGGGHNGGRERRRDHWMGGDARSLARLSLVVLAVVLVSVLSGAGRTVAIVFALVAMVMLHELGHLLTAKWGGMKVTEYFLGFGPRLWSIRRGETEYGVKALPAGGYVRVLGMTSLEEVDPADEPRTYRQASFPRRLSVALAGSAMHFLIAFVLLWSLFALVGVPDPGRAQVDQLAAVDGHRGPAAEAGVRPGDVIVSAAGRPVTSIDALSSVESAHAGRPVSIVVDRGGRLVTLRVVPEQVQGTSCSSSGAPGASGGSAPAGGSPAPGSSPGTSGPVRACIGVELTAASVTGNPVSAVGKAIQATGRTTVETVSALGGIFSPHGLSSYAHQVLNASPGPSSPSSSSARLESPVGIVRLASQAAATSAFDVIWLLVLINIFVGVFNLVPLLPLDGGHVAIAVYERIRSRGGRRYHVDAARLLPATYVAFLVIVLLGVTALYMDVVHPLSNPFK
jgi:membrane-associated protease RseP (regulator of RpoE activity)